MQNRPNRRPPRIRPLKQMRPALIALIDILVIGVCLSIFALFDHVIPQPSRRVVSTTPPPASAAPPAPASTVSPDASASPDASVSPTSLHPAR